MLGESLQKLKAFTEIYRKKQQPPDFPSAYSRHPTLSYCFQKEALCDTWVLQQETKHTLKHNLITCRGVTPGMSL